MAVPTIVLKLSTAEPPNLRSTAGHIFTSFLHFLTLDYYWTTYYISAMVMSTMEDGWREYGSMEMEAGAAASMAWSNGMEDKQRQ